MAIEAVVAVVAVVADVSATPVACATMLTGATFGHPERTHASDQTLASTMPDDMIPCHFTFKQYNFPNVATPDHRTIETMCFILKLKRPNVETVDMSRE